ncbi:MAG: hypothetical protein ABSA93_35195 [Streptosporangiaceae bacterium]|jgi:hypothetical protein
MLHVRSWATTIAAAGIAVLLAVGPASAQSWTIVSAPPTGENGQLAAVSAVSDTDAWAVGSTNAELNSVGAKALIDNWNGTAWTQVATPTTPGNTAYLTAVSASSTTDAWAVGRTQENREDFAPLGLHWNGSAWSVSSSFATALAGQIADGVADISSSDAYAIGGGLGSADTGLVAQWNGSTWSQVAVPRPSGAGPTSTLNAISASGPDDVWIAGTYELSSTDLRSETYSLHWTGSSWSVVPMPLNPSSNIDAFYQINSVQVNSPTDVWAVGYSSVVDSTTATTLIEHWNGTAWSIVPSPTPGSGAALDGVTTSNAANDVWAVGSYTPAGTTETQTLTLNWNGTEWTQVTSPDNGSPSVLLSASTNPGASIVWAVGSSGECCTENPLILQNG